MFRTRTRQHSSRLVSSCLSTLSTAVYSWAIRPHVKTPALCSVKIQRMLIRIQPKGAHLVPYIIRRDEHDAPSHLVSPSPVSSCLVTRIVNYGVLVVTRYTTSVVVESERRLIRRRFVRRFKLSPKRMQLSTTDWEHHFLVGFPSFVVQLSSMLMSHRMFDA